jgi:hypothetical protein
MAKGQDFTPYQRKIVDRYYEHKDTIMAQKLGELVSELYLCADPAKAQRLWDSARTALRNMGVPPSRIETLMTKRSAEALAEVVNEVALGGSAKAARTEHGAPVASGASAGPAAPAALVPPAGPGQAPAQTPPGQTPAPVAIAPETLKSAMKAFRRRLKLTRLDEESQLTRRALTSGQASAVAAIIPPHEFPKAVWEELARQGKLKYTGGGFYALGPQL